MQQAEGQKGRERTGMISYVMMLKAFDLEWPGKWEDAEHFTSDRDAWHDCMWPNVMN